MRDTCLARSRSPRPLSSCIGPDREELKLYEKSLDVLLRVNPKVLAQADVRPTEFQRARLDGWDIRIAPRATLVPSDKSSVYGVITQLTHSDLEKLYAQNKFGFGSYFPEAVLVVDPATRLLPALCYIAWETVGGTPSAEYIDKVISAAQQFEFPGWYIEHIKSFGVDA